MTEQSTEYVYDRFTCWRLDDGRYHRVGGPAIETKDGSKEWFINGKYHREDGPAVEYANGTKEWRTNGKLHREDGPARILLDGTKEWWVRGKLIYGEYSNE